MSINSIKKHMKTAFTRNKHVNKYLQIFFLFTIATLIIGLVIKFVLIIHFLVGPIKDLKSFQNTLLGAINSPNNVSSTGGIGLYLTKNIHEFTKASGGDSGDPTHLFPILNLIKQYIGHSQNHNIPAVTDYELMQSASISLNKAKDLLDQVNLITILQFVLVILTFIFYPFGIIKIFKIKNDPKLKYTRKIHKRLMIEYILFLVIFIIVDALSVKIMFENGIEWTTWNTYSFASVFIPTGFATGSIILLLVMKKHLLKKAK